jgi:predicted GNAT family N-acyltransferase
MSELIIRIADFVKDYDEIFGIRDVVFIKGQDCPYDEEVDGLDSESEHFLAYMDEEVVGYCRLRMVGKKAKMERFAVYEKWRGEGIGKALVKHLLDLLEVRNVEVKFLNAQTRTKSFYQGLGFKEEGDLFWEAGIEHIAMYFEG